MIVIYFAPWGGGEKRQGPKPPGAFLVLSYPPSGRGIVIPVLFFIIIISFFLGGVGHLPQTSGFRSAKQILVASFATQARACILSDHNIFYTPRGGRTTPGLMPLELFLFFGRHLPQIPGFCSAKKILVANSC